MGGNAIISDNTTVSGNAKIFDRAQVRDSAVISHYAILRGDAIISANARVRDMATVEDRACVTDDAHIGGSVFIGGTAIIDGISSIRASRACIAGNAEIHNSDVFKTCSRSDGYEFAVFPCADKIWRVTAGCRFFTMDEAWNHWVHTRGDTDTYLGAETLDILWLFDRHIERMERRE